MTAGQDFFKKRRAGILLHPTSLPETPSNGDLGQSAYRFVDFLADCQISIWQMLPLGPPHEDLSPYQCQSVHAANPLLISLEKLVAKGWLSEDSSPRQEKAIKYELRRLSRQGWYHPGPVESELTKLLASTPFKAGFCPLSHQEMAIRYRHARLREAHAGFMKSACDRDRVAYSVFLETQADWLTDYALFRALQAEHLHQLQAECLKALHTIRDPKILHHHLTAIKNRSGWWAWSTELRERQPQALQAARQQLVAEIEQHYFEQFVFFTQWQELKQYANEQGIYLFGDIPIFVALDSVDVWASRQNFLLDAQGQPTVVAGVPPDYFSATGQRWGNPHYNWKYMQSHEFQWWINRLSSAELLFDIARIDHFRGFEACWAIPRYCETAIEGQWVKVPGEALFKKLQQVGTLPLIAEDLGVITDEVRALRDQFNLPGMKILQFAFDSGAGNPYLPHNHVENSVVYTGTHDNNTTLGWFRELTTPIQQYVCDYLHALPDDMPWPLIEAAFASVAHLAVVPMQDILGLDGQHRMNTPGTSTGNWRWRFDWSQIPPGLTEKLRHFSSFYGRI
ncbi:glycoside hydrolase, family 77 [Thioploca ingrica]|uniref:4-alpha-glucanotransferase n=1 Tax=Thioploca ingrica TaxID=40754 RepID=A0A090AFA7_9GAMM|nr:glycoside hydrolase, family 77 [Thioploca ingrica]